MEPHHRRFVFGTDRTDGDRRCRPSWSRSPRSGSDRGGWRSWGTCSSVTSGPCTTTRASSAIRPSGDASSGLISISLIQRCSATSALKRTIRYFECGKIHRPAAAHAFERLVDLGLLHHAARQRGVERRQAERAVFKDLDELAAGSEEQHRTELRVEAAADDQLVRVLQLDHGLHGDALEMLARRLFR